MCSLPLFHCHSLNLALTGTSGLQEAEGGILLIGAYMRMLKPEGEIDRRMISLPCYFLRIYSKYTFQVVFGGQIPEDLVFGKVPTY